MQRSDRNPRQGVLRKEAALRRQLPAQKDMKPAWPLRSRRFCLLDFVGQNPMLATIVDSDSSTQNAEIRLVLISKYRRHSIGVVVIPYLDIHAIPLIYIFRHFDLQ